jgi:hypothetical protein
MKINKSITMKKRIILFLLISIINLSSCVQFEKPIDEALNKVDPPKKDIEFAKMIKAYKHSKSIEIRYQLEHEGKKLINMKFNVYLSPELNEKNLVLSSVTDGNGSIHFTTTLKRKSQYLYFNYVYEDINYTKEVSIDSILVSSELVEKFLSILFPKAYAVETKTWICHKGRQNIEVSNNSINAHLNHGDELGKCSEQTEQQRGQSKTTICHLPGGDITKGVTIEIANPAVDKHIDLHGDFIGPCPGEPPGEEQESLTAQYYPALCTMGTLAFEDRWPFFWRL